MSFNRIKEGDDLHVFDKERNFIFDCVVMDVKRNGPEEVDFLLNNGDVVHISDFYGHGSTMENKMLNYVVTTNSCVAVYYLYEQIKKNGNK